MERNQPGPPADDLYSAFENTVQKAGDKTALIFLGDKFSFLQVREMVLSVAASLHHMDKQRFFSAEAIMLLAWSSMAV